MFCKFTDLQLQLYKHFTQSSAVRKLLSGSGSQPLKAITFLKKLCNHPALIDPKDFGGGANELFPQHFDPRGCQSEFSGKMMLLQQMLEKMRYEICKLYVGDGELIRFHRKTSTDKIVLISNYTQTLDLFERMCRSRMWGHLRLDGSMTIQKRQKLVDRFNDPTGPEFVFLLSSKAGGCGINLVRKQISANVFLGPHIESCFLLRLGQID